MHLNLCLVKRLRWNLAMQTHQGGARGALQAWQSEFGEILPLG
jgi:hypothetical protein